MWVSLSWRVSASTQDKACFPGSPAPSPSPTPFVERGGWSQPVFFSFFLELPVLLIKDMGISFTVILPFNTKFFSRRLRERQRSGGGAGAFNVLLGVWVHKANGLAWVCKLRSCSSQTTSCPGVQEAGGPRWRWGPGNCVNPRRLVCGDDFVTMSLHTELCFEGGCPPHWLQ